MKMLICLNVFCLQVVALMVHQSLIVFNNELNPLTQKRYNVKHMISLRNLLSIVPGYEGYTKALQLLKDFSR